MARTKEQNAEYYKNNKEAIAARYKVYYDANKEQLRVGQAERQKLHREQNPDKHAISHIIKTYKVPREYAIDLHKRASNTCDSCGVLWSPILHKRLFCVDHDHITGKVRGILCMDCNTSLGKLKESTAKILALAAYNERYNGNK